jgi:thioredoxin-dependent peroxiredoxin
MIVLGVSFDSVQENESFARKFNFPFQLLSDPERRMGLDYHAASDPDQGYADRITYVIGPDGRILQAFEKVNVETHAGDVLASLA